MTRTRFGDSGQFPVATTAPLVVHWTDLDGAAPADAWADQVDASERARADRFVQPLHRHRHLVAHAWVRALLAPQAARDPRLLAFSTGPYGKPSLAHAPAFNLSHSDALAVLAIAPAGDIGVDVERLRTVSDATALAAHHFTPAERAELAASPDPTAAFLLGWTRKEACMKAAGCGLQVEPAALETGLGEGAREVHFHSPDGPVTAVVRSLRDGTRAIVSWAWLTRRP